MKRRAVIVGAGVAGLTAAALLAARGWQTTVLEALETPGGRAAQRTIDGYTFDLGPSLLFMCDVFRAAFARWGGDFDAEVRPIRLTPNYTMHYPGGAALTISPVLGETMASLEALAPGSSRRLLRYFAGSARSYEIARREFTDHPISNIFEFITPKKLYWLAKSGALGNLARRANRDFGAPSVAAAFSFQSMYLGMSPYESPELYRLLFFTELGEGIHFPLGGIGALPRALARAVVNNGGEICYGRPVVSIERDNGRARAALTADERYDADIVLIGADLPYAYAHLLDEPNHRSLRMRHTPSALVIYLGLDRAYEDLLHHEFLMPADLGETCADIFGRGMLPSDPAIYLCAPARTDPAMAPPGGEALYVLVPCPNLDGVIDWENEREAIVDRIIDRIEQRRLPGLRARITVRETRTPLEFERVLNLNRGAAFGLSHDLLQIGPMRPDNRHRSLHNVYFAGSSTRPATGLPLVAMSAMQTVDRIERDLAHA